VAHITQLGSGIGGDSHASDVAHITQPGSGISGDSQVSVAVQAVGLYRLPLYIEASTNPLPSGYAFNAASPIATLQHGHVNPLPKETLHHG